MSAFALIRVDCAKRASTPRAYIASRFISTRSQEDLPPDFELKSLNLPNGIKRLKKDTAHFTTSTRAIPEEEVLSLLISSYHLATCLVFGVGRAAPETENEQGQDLTEAVLQDLSEERSRIGPVFVPDNHISASFREDAIGQISELVFTLLRDPKVFISPKILEMYVRIQCLLGRPEYLPEIFNLYAHKKIPDANAQPVTYREPWPKMPKYAVPITLAEAALEAAILKKNLALALAIIDTTVATPAFRAHKILSRAALPLSLVAGTPLIAYVAADWVSRWQNTMDVEMSRHLAIAGGLAYIATLSTIGFVAITTSNDQMVRVVWRPGTKLSARWVREDERAFLDRVALAWGFRERFRWGEEQGDEWHVLRDECGTRDMILDKTELMEGMQ